MGITGYNCKGSIQGCGCKDQIKEGKSMSIIEKSLIMAVEKHEKQIEQLTELVESLRERCAELLEENRRLKKDFESKNVQYKSKVVLNKLGG